MNYYVVLQRLTKVGCHEEDIVSIYDEAEAFKHEWIDQNGNRIWVVPPTEETSPTFVWKFPEFTRALVFFDTLRSAEIGIPCSTP